MKAFITWKHKGIRYLAVPGDGQSVRIIDDNGTNYGSFYTLKNFKAFLQRGEASPLGTCKVELYTL